MKSILAKLPKILLIAFLHLFILQMLIFLFFWLSPLLAQAQAEKTAPVEKMTNPAYDPACWRETQCRKICGERCQWKSEKGTGGRCDGGTGEWGKCYPPTATIPLQIALQGTTEVVDIADYIAKIYQYTVGIGGILATVMIIWGGVVYLTAGGNPSKISQAKEYISNALIGSVLLFTSYLLLQTINPDLVKLRMPTVYLLRPIALTPDLCKDLPQSKMAYAGPVQGPYKPLDEIQESDFKEAWPGKCNSAYYPSQEAIDVCFGTICTGDLNPECAGTSPCVCMPSANKFSCQKVRFGGAIAYEDDRYVDDICAIALCQNSRHFGSQYFLRVLDCEPSIGSGDHVYDFDESEIQTRGALGLCANEEGGIIWGFFLGLEIAEDSWLDTTDDVYFGGKGLCQSPSIPLSTRAGHTGSAHYFGEPRELMAFDMERNLTQTEFEELKSIAIPDPFSTSNPAPCNLNIQSSYFPER